MLILTPLKTKGRTNIKLGTTDHFFVVCNVIMTSQSELIVCKYAVDNRGIAFSAQMNARTQLTNWQKFYPVRVQDDITVNA